MNARSCWLPPPPRYLPGQRWLNIMLRGLHLIGIVGLSGGMLFDLPEAHWQAYWHLTLTTGTLLAALYIWTDVTWLLMLKGQVILVKLTLLALIHVYPGWRVEIFVLIIALATVFARASSRA